MQSFVADNREALGTTSDKLAVGHAGAGRQPRRHQAGAAHRAQRRLQNFINIYEPANGALTGALAVNNFANPIPFLCGAIQAASRLGAEQSAKLCVQYLAPIVKNRQYNFPPLGHEPVRRSARRGPTRSPTARIGCGPTTFRRHPASQQPPPPAGSGSQQRRPRGPPLAAEAPRRTDPAAGLPGLMVPPGVGP